jgi:hypothetical protein
MKTMGPQMIIKMPLPVPMTVISFLATSSLEKVNILVGEYERMSSGQIMPTVSFPFSSVGTARASAGLAYP